ncbi:MAG: transposase [Proteobacteria bacterium]|nr:transposase [Pseudomonadota bacterium]
MQHAGWRSRGYIPHCDGAGVVQHIVMSTIGATDGIEANFGQHFFETPEAAEIVEKALLHFDGERYRMLAWCVMSNHVHAIVEQMDGWPLANVAHSWKSFTANEVNRLLGRKGPLWMREYFDRFMRDDDHLNGTIFYVENNPVTAGLVECPPDWRWSSARLRMSKR